MSLRITIKLAKRFTRELEIAMTEDQLAQCRSDYWKDRKTESTTEFTNEELVEAALVLEARHISFGDHQKQKKVAMYAVATPTLFVGGVYWYRDRSPPSSPHTRVRAFAMENGNIECPRCHCILLEDGTYNVKPHQFSKLMGNPHFICEQCNAHVIVSSRREDYERKRLQDKEAGEDNDTKD